MIVQTDLPDHWKTQILKSIVGDGACEYLLRLWGHCQHRKSEYFSNLPIEAVKAICRYQGPAEQLDRALTESRFIERKANTVRVLHFMDYNKKLFSSPKNGKSGGRPKKLQETPENYGSVSRSLSTPENLTITYPKPNGNLTITKNRVRFPRVDKRRVDKRRIDNTPLTPLACAKGELFSKDSINLRLCQLFGRRPTTQWSDKELRAFNKLFPFPPEDFELIEWFYQLPTAEDARKYRRKDLATLLNNWSGELDRAQSFRNGPGRNLNGMGATTMAEKTEKRFNQALDAKDEKLLEENKKVYESSEDYLMEIALECKVIDTNHPSGMCGSTRFKLESLNQEQRQKLLTLANGASAKINQYYESLNT
jgi:hypothetical protein